MEVTYKRDASNNYMVIRPQEQTDAEDYRIHMIAENHPEGLLHFGRKILDGENYYFYEITSRHSIRQICTKERLDETTLRAIFRGMYQTLQEMKRYLLEADGLVLEPETVYMDVETKQPGFCYLPGYKEDFQSEFRRFTEYLLQQIDPSASEAVLLCYRIYRGAMEENGSIERLLRDDVLNLTSEKTTPLMAENKIPSLENTNAIPQGRAGHGYGDHIAKDSERQMYHSERRKQILPIKNTEKANTEKSNTAHGREQKRDKNPNTLLIWRLAGAAALLASCGCLGAAYYMGMLNVTQLGGILFLLVGVIAYGGSYVRKQKKTDAQRIRKREQEAIRRYEREERREEQALRGYERVERREEQQAIRGYEREEQREEQQALRVYEREERKEEPDRAENIGATTVLIQGSDSFASHLGLISMNPRERNSVVLLNESYTVGKLKNKCDIYINDPSISRMHARIVRENGEYYLCDMNSTNGTYLNGRRLGVNERAPLKLTDEISFAELGYYVGKC
ncbi:MAG: DUF6382 domain-containing protein [Eubacteriales bacterium]|nr:DUF6382 domain-containing protein [Eubacteriales bacterium]